MDIRWLVRTIITITRNINIRSMSLSDWLWLSMFLMRSLAGGQLQKTKYPSVCTFKSNGSYRSTTNHYHVAGCPCLLNFCLGPLVSYCLPTLQKFPLLLGSNCVTCWNSLSQHGPTSMLRLGGVPTGWGMWLPRWSSTSEVSEYLEPMGLPGIPYHLVMQTTPLFYSFLTSVCLWRHLFAVKGFTIDTLLNNSVFHES
jgi:hypothetical protein